jgi:hypothetical protein
MGKSQNGFRGGENFFEQLVKWSNAFKDSRPKSGFWPIILNGDVPAALLPSAPFKGVLHCLGFTMSYD